MPTPNPWHSKLDPRAHKYIFVVYPHNQKGYKCIDQALKKYFVSMNATFFEVTHFYTNSHILEEQYHQDWNKSEFSMELYVNYTTDFSHRTLETKF